MCLFAGISPLSVQKLSDEFRDPPQEARIRVCWHWMDLEACQALCDPDGRPAPAYSAPKELGDVALKRAWTVSFDGPGAPEGERLSFLLGDEVVPVLGFFLPFPGAGYQCQAC